LLPSGPGGVWRFARCTGPDRKQVNNRNQSGMRSIPKKFLVLFSKRTNFFYIHDIEDAIQVIISVKAHKIKPLFLHLEKPITFK